MASRKAAAAASAAAVSPLRIFVRRAALNKTNNRQLQPVHTWKIVRGDLVFVRSGRSAGQTGRVLEVLRRRNRLVVEGLNLVRRHVRAEGSTPGGAIAMPSAIHYSNLALVDPTLGKPARVAIRFTAAGEKVRVSKRSGAVIPWPAPALKYDRPLRPAEPGPQDTPAAAAALVTYEPPAALRPYLAGVAGLGRAARAATRSVFGEPSAGTGAAAEERRVPELLQTVRLRRGNRNEMRARWAARAERGRLAREVNEAVGKILVQAARENASAASAAESAATPAPRGGAGGRGAPGAAREVLR
jgi:large subunit ribosomal protein L24